MTSTIGGGSITVGIGTAQISAASSSTLTFGPKANATSLTYTPQASFVGTINISAKLITPISTYSYVAKDSTGATSFHALYQTLGSLYNFFLGGGGAYNTTGYSNSAQGANALYSNTTGGSNSAQGYQSLYSNTTGSSNSAQGVNALNSNTTGSYNYGAGYQAGRYISDGSTANQTSSYSIYLGTNPMALNSGDDNEIVIGGDATGGATGAGSNTTTIGTPRQTDVYFGGTGIPSNIHAGFYMGPATAPSGSCTTNGAWVFSQDGHATFCNSGTWATKI
jgi:hypothetical protein